MADGSVIIDFNGDTKDLEKDINSVESKLKSGFSKIGNVAGTALKGTTVAIGTVTTALTGLVTASVNAYAEYEQLVGGVDTLFKNSSKKLQQYADEAYKTAGLSANEYMSTVTSFSASLLQSLGGDTEKAADYANQALIDMSDNANKMGTSMESIQWAYQGFAKQNYTMLDNLKLGYGGTKEEMQRLLEDAEKLTGVKYDISSFADVTQAIHAIQTELGITGTTAKEASTTIQGSLNSVKGAWNNLLVGITNSDADFDKLISNLVETLITAGENILPAIESALVGIIDLVSKLFPTIAQELPKLIVEILPKLIQAGIEIIYALLDGIRANLPEIANSAVEIITTLITGIINLLPQILETGIQLIVQLILGIAKQLPELIPQAINAIILMVETLIDNLDLLVDAGIELLLALTMGIIEALPQLVNKVPEIINKLFDALMKNLPKLVDAGMQIIVMLITGLINSIPNLIGQIPNLIKMVFNALTSGFQIIWQVGKGLVEGFWNGIVKAGTWLANKIKGWCNTIVDNIKGFFGIHSPSKLFRDEIGENLGLGLGEGFEESLKTVYKNMKKSIEYENAKLTANLTTTQQVQVQKEDNRQAILESIENNREIQVNSTLNLDGKVVANAVNKVNTRQKLQYGLA